MRIVDAHLDLAYNASRGRDPRMPAANQPVVENEIATVGLPDLSAGGVGLICATIFCEPANPSNPHGYTSPEQAQEQAISQLTWYRRCIDQRLLTFLTSLSQLAPEMAPLPAPKTIPNDLFQPVHPRDEPETRVTPPLQTILLLEGADAIRSPDDLSEWFDNGLRIIGLAWKRTRFAGGTGAPGPLTDEGRVLIREIDRRGILHDASHLAEQSFWDLMDLTDRPVMASHSNCRSIVEGDRQLSDEMIRAIAARGGVIGINFYDKFLLPRSVHGKRRATLTDVADHIKHICDLTGSAKHVGLGTDMDGGLGREQIPVEIQTSADLPRLGDVLAKDFSAPDIRAILGSNWVSFFETNLPR